MAVLPKNQETIGLLDRWLSPDERYTMTEIMLGDFREPAADATAPEEAVEPDDRSARRRERRETEREARRQTSAETRETSAWFIIGTSVLFELGLLTLGAWIFARRDF